MINLPQKKVSSKGNIKKLKEKLIKSKLAYFGFQEKPKNIPDKDWNKKNNFFFALKSLVMTQTEH